MLAPPILPWSPRSNGVVPLLTLSVLLLPLAVLLAHSSLHYLELVTGRAIARHALLLHPGHRLGVLRGLIPHAEVVVRGHAPIRYATSAAHSSHDG